MKKYKGFKAIVNVIKGNEYLKEGLQEWFFRTRTEESTIARVNEAAKRDKLILEIISVEPSTETM